MVSVTKGQLIGGITGGAGGGGGGGSTPGPAAYPTDIQNGSFDTGDLTGWTLDFGTAPSIVTSEGSGQPSPAPGSTHFLYGGVANQGNRISQRVAFLEADLVAIDADQRNLNILYQHSSVDGFDGAEIYVQFFDLAENPLGIDNGSFFDPPSNNTWTSGVFALPIPPLARSYRLGVQTVRTGGTNNNAYVDNVSQFLSPSNEILMDFAKTFAIIGGPANGVGIDRASTFVILE